MLQHPKIRILNDKREIMDRDAFSLQAILNSSRIVPAVMLPASNPLFLDGYTNTSIFQEAG
jgi:hypothetical protein